MKRLRCPKCDRYVVFDETQYADGQVLVFVCSHCQKEFKIRLGGASRPNPDQPEEKDCGFITKTALPIGSSSLCTKATT